MADPSQIPLPAFNMGDLAVGVFIIALIAAVILAVMGAFMLGFLESRPYKCLIFSPRQNGAMRHETRKGRKMKNGKFEIFYAWNDKSTIECPKEEFFDEANGISFLHPTRDTFIPIQRIELGAETLKLITDPTMDNAMKVIFTKEARETVERLSKPDPFVQYMPWLSVILACIILGGSLLWGLQSVAGGMTAQTNAIVKNTEYMNEIYANSTVHVVREEYVTPTTKTGQSVTAPGALPAAPG